MNIKVPELESLPLDKQQAILKECMDSDEYKSLVKRQGPQPFRYSGIIMIPIVGIIALNDQIWGAIAAGILVFILGVPLIYFINLQKKISLIRSMVKEKIDQKGIS